MTTRRHTLRLTGSVIALAAAGLGSRLLAQGVEPLRYPNRPVRFIVPFPPGGGNDILARLFGPRLAESLGQPVMIDNRPGAGGNLGTDLAAKAAGDGYTILIASNQVTINPGLGQKLPFDIEVDFAPVALLASVPMLLVVHPSLPFRSVTEFVAGAKSQSARMNYGTPGAGTPQHLAFELFNKMAGVEVVHVPYKGTGPAIADLLGGQIQAAFGTLASVAPHVKAGKLRPLAVATAKRSALIPDVPTVAESGVPGFDAPLWYSVLSPAGTPREVVARLAAELQKICAAPEVRERMAEQGFEPEFLGSAELQALIRRDLARWQKIGRETGLRIE